MHDPIEPVIYQFKVVLRRVTPMIWRRLLVRSDSTIADLHDILQIGMGLSFFPNGDSSTIPAKTDTGAIAT